MQILGKKPLGLKKKSPLRKLELCWFLYDLKSLLREIMNFMPDKDIMKNNFHGTIFDFMKNSIDPIKKPVGLEKKSPLHKLEL